jgi:ubiquinone/menaquinone biosynthesis C-methylase UbiE
MSPIDLLIIVISMVLLLAAFIGLFRLDVPRRASIEGIEDPEAAEAYDRLSRMPQFALIRRSFVKKLRRYAVEGSITDVGCGPGYLLLLIAEELPAHKLVGVDISGEMVGRAKANFDTVGLGGRAEFRVGSAERLPFNDDTQDLIVSTLSLHHWADPQSAFDEFYRVLRPGGQIFMLDLRRDARQLFFWLMWFAQNVALRVLGLGALTRINEPTGSLLASYISKEIEVMLSKTRFRDHRIEGKLGWIYLWGRKELTCST